MAKNYLKQGNLFFYIFNSCNTTKALVIDYMKQPKKEFFKLLALFLALAFLIGGCKKRRAFKEEDGQSAVDILNARSENDQALNFANHFMSEQNVIRGRNLEEQKLEGINSATLCGAVVDTSNIYSGVLSINFTGGVCDNRKREGRIVFTIQNYPGKRWKQKGCVMKIDFQAYKVTNMVSNKIVQFDGTEYLTNESGGTWYELKYLNQPSLLHTLSATDLIVRFDRGENAAYSIGRQTTYTFSKNIIFASMEGTGVQGDLLGLECWGQTRTGAAFTSQVVSPVTWNTTCGTSWLTGGEINLKVDSKDFELNMLFNTDSQGTPVNLNTGQCGYGWQLKWSYKRNTNKRIFTYN